MTHTRTLNSRRGARFPAILRSRLIHWPTRYVFYSIIRLYIIVRICDQILANKTVDVMVCLKLIFVLYYLGVLRMFMVTTDRQRTYLIVINMKPGSQPHTSTNTV